MTAEQGRGLALAQRLKDHARELGFETAGIAALRPSAHAAFLRAWLEAGHHGSMDYLARADATSTRTDPRSRWPELKCALLVTLPYTYDHVVAENVPAERGVIARYARGRDYHKVIRQKLLVLVQRLEQETGRPHPLARAYVDTGPLLERELAERAGLGWFGRNTMLIDPRRGSFFFIAAVLLDMELPSDEPFIRDHCGTCNNCVQACPTGALLGRDERGAPVIDARRCISYLTIEQRGPIPPELRPLIGNRIFGCDICQEVCPWNGPKFVQLTREPSFAARAADAAPAGVERMKTDGHHPGTASPSLIDLLEMDEAGWEAFSRGSPLRRAGYAGFRRNVAVALGNWGDESAVPSLRSSMHDNDPLVRSHAAWALGKIASRGAVAALTSALSAETDHAVIEEINAALASVSAAFTGTRDLRAR